MQGGPIFLHGFGDNMRVVEVDEIYPLSDAQRMRVRQLIVAFALLKDMNGLRIMYDRPDRGILHQLIRAMFHEDGSPKSIVETAEF